MPLPTAYLDLVEIFSELPDTDERLRFLIDLGRRLVPLDEGEKTDETYIHGCVSSVWLICRHDEETDTVEIRGESDALIVSGLIAILLARFNGAGSDEILATGPGEVLSPLGLESYVSPGRRNGLAAMMQRIHACAASSSRK